MDRETPIIIEDKPTKAHANYLYDYTERNLHLAYLVNAMGKAEIYDSLSQCNRCGYCANVCPTYILEKNELVSARGRNQIIKMMVEGRIKSKEQSSFSLFTCLLCGACASACYAGVPTNEHVLEARRSIKNYSENPVLKISIRLLLKAPGFFALLLKIAILLKKLGFSSLVSRIGIFHILGVPQMAEAESALRRLPLKFLSEYLAKDKEISVTSDVRWLYFTSCGPNFIYPEVGLATVNVLKRFLGRGASLRNVCCGLMAYNYGKMEDARKFARKNIEIFEEISSRAPDAKIVVDCSSCASFLKNYPRLFHDENWRKRAENFSGNVLDILQALPVDTICSVQSGETDKFAPVTYHDSCRACHGQNIRKEPREILKKVLGKNFLEMPESDWCCGGAGVYFFTQEEMSKKILLRKIKNVSAIHAKTVVAGSTSCLIQLEKGLAKYYPSAQVMHYSVFLNKIFNKC